MLSSYENSWRTPFEALSEFTNELPNVDTRLGLNHYTQLLFLLQTIEQYSSPTFDLNDLVRSATTTLPQERQFMDQYIHEHLERALSLVKAALHYLAQTKIFQDISPTQNSGRENIPPLAPPPPFHEWNKQLAKHIHASPHKWRQLLLATILIPPIQVNRGIHGAILDYLEHPGDDQVLHILRLLNQEKSESSQASYLEIDFDPASAAQFLIKIIHFLKNISERSRFIPPYETEALTQYGFTPLTLNGFPAFQPLLDKTLRHSQYGGTMSIFTGSGQKKFIHDWTKLAEEEVHLLPPPCHYSGDDFWFLQSLARNKIYHLPHTTAPLSTLNYAPSQTLLLCKPEPNLVKQLAKILGIESTLRNGSFIPRPMLDQALYSPHSNQKTTGHRHIIEQCGLNPTYYEIRPINYDEWSRLGIHCQPNSGQSLHFAGYYRDPYNHFYGLSGGMTSRGGYSHISYTSPDTAHQTWLVIAPMMASVKQPPSDK